MVHDHTGDPGTVAQRRGEIALPQPPSGGEADLLLTKLAPPRLRVPLVARPALLARLDAGLERALTLISAPAGFGKTTLVLQWLTTRGVELSGSSPGSPWTDSAQTATLQTPALRAAWLALDHGDNDPVRFWRYVLAACRAFDPAIGESVLPLLHRTQPPWDAVLARFSNDLGRLARRCVLVLEDYHAITTPVIHAQAATLLDHLPPALHLIVITRSDPPLPLARLRARAELSELRAADLRFSPAEAQAFLAQALPFPLVPEAVAPLEARTEGWVTGLRLLALALEGHHEPQTIAHALATFTGSSRAVAEYLVEEVLAAQPAPIQRFLLQTSVLDRLTAPLCDALTGRTDSARCLEHLERANLFLVPLDDERHWYRYHALFAEAMRHHARLHFGADGVRALYDQASRWYAQHALRAEAVDAALAAQAFPRAAALIERWIEHPDFKHELHTLRRWIDQVPHDVLRAHPALGLRYAVAILFTSDRRAPATAAQLELPLALAEQSWQAAGDRPNLGVLFAFRSLVAWWQGELPEMFAAARQALALLPEDELEHRGISLISVAMEELYAGKPAAAWQALLEARMRCEAGSNPHGVLAATLLMGQVCVEQGDLHQAAQCYRYVLAEAEKAEVGEPGEDQGAALAGLAALAFEWNDLESAEHYAAQALEIGTQIGALEILVPTSLALARTLHARGQRAQAQDVLQRLIAAMPQRRWRPLVREAHACQAWLALASGDMATAQRWYTNYAQHPADIPHAQQEREALIVARLLIAQGDGEAALQLLERWQADAQAHGRMRSALEIMVLRALAYQAHHDHRAARHALLQALAIAHPHGYLRLFLDAGEAMEALLHAIAPDVRAEPLATYVRALLHALKLERGARQLTAKGPFAHAAHGGSLVEPLSQQEQRVLYLLVAGLSYPEIAQELIVSVNTIKTHVKNIYRKLNVSNRSQARAMARQLQLFSRMRNGASDMLGEQEPEPGYLKYISTSSESAQPQRQAADPHAPTNAHRRVRMAQSGSWR